MSSTFFLRSRQTSSSLHSRSKTSLSPKASAVSGVSFINEPGQVTLYAIVKLGLGLALYMGGIILLEIVALIVGLIFFLVIFLVGFLLGLLHVPPAILSVLLFFAIALFYLLFLYFFMLGLGALLTFFEAYNLYFLGGRYPMLGDLLEQSTPPVSVATQLPPGPPYSYPPPNIPHNNAMM